MSTAQTHSTAITPDGLTVCCEQDPRTVEGGFVDDGASCPEGTPAPPKRTARESPDG